MALKIVLPFCLGVLATAVCGSNDTVVRYDNHHVYSVHPSDVQELHTLRKLRSTMDSVLFLDGLHTVGHHVQAVVAPHLVPDFIALMNATGIRNHLLETDLQRKFERIKATKRSPHGYDWTEYHELDDTHDWLRSLEKNFTKILTLVVGGQSYENRPILGVRISHKPGNKAIFIEAGMHAREWISPATATFIINQLLTSNVTSVMTIARNYDWYIFPHTNPDGYVYSCTTDRMWRKTRKPNADNATVGVDPNRNWDDHWNEVGSDQDHHSDSYAGPSAFSEIETKTLSNYIATLKDTLKMYISLHSNAQLLLYPYGYTQEEPPNARDLEAVSQAAIAALSKRYGTRYGVGQISTAMYPTSGTSVEWVYDKLGVRMAFAYELRPDRFDSCGFDLPASQIIPTGEETLDSIVAMIAEAKRLGYFDD